MKTYEEIVDALHATLVTIDEIGDARNILNYIPKDIHTSPLMFIMDVVSTQEAARSIRYIATVRLCVIWQVGETAQGIFNGLINSVREAITMGSDLGGVITSGMAWVAGTATGLYEMPPGSGKVYRTCDFDIEIVDKSQP